MFPRQLCLKKTLKMAMLKHVLQIKDATDKQERHICPFQQKSNILADEGQGLKIITKAKRD